MPKYVAFLRAINVGKHQVKMDHLRRLFEAMGFANVETFIASGNVIFDSRVRNASALERKIEISLETSLGYAVATFIRPVTDLSEIANRKLAVKLDPMVDGVSLYIGFLASAPAAEAKRKVRSFSTSSEEFDVVGREVYWVLRKTFSTSNVSPALLEKTIGVPATFRNVNTVRRLAERYS
jgi:uncharacterized protein (DUF1697 family)